MAWGYEMSIRISGRNMHTKDKSCLLNKFYAPNIMKERGITLVVLVLGFINSLILQFELNLVHQFTSIMLHTDSFD